jgi:predicted metalloprotease with PDZ domain
MTAIRRLDLASRSRALAVASIAILAGAVLAVSPRLGASGRQAPDGVPLAADETEPNRWRIATGGRSSVTFTYTLSAGRGSNLSNGVTETSAVIIGPAGRLVQTLEQASARMFERIPADQKVDDCVKGPVVGLVLDAHIRRRTDGAKSLDDAMRLEYERWSGAHGYTSAQFNQTVSDAAGFDVSDLLHRLIATTDEIDYTEMLDWFGLRFRTGDPAQAWTLETRPDATPAQRAHFAALLAPSRAR